MCRDSGKVTPSFRGQFISPPNLAPLGRGAFPPLFAIADARLFAYRTLRTDCCYMQAHPIRKEGGWEVAATVRRMVAAAPDRFLKI